MKIVITGGAGFIGSHLTEALATNAQVIVFDNLSSGRRSFLAQTSAELIKGDIRNLNEIKDTCKHAEIVYHFAADPDVRCSWREPLEHFRINVAGTLNVLESCRMNDVKQLVFASSSTVYGNADTPTLENAPIVPISNYGAAKAAGEHYISVYSQLYGMQGIVLRYANIIGPRLTHGVVYDFYNKLKKNPRELEILGNGEQRKSYLHVRDAVQATLLVAKKTKKKFDVFNIGSEEQITVKDIADLIVSEITLKDVEYKYAGNKIGWPGDIPIMLLSIAKLRSLQWKPKFTINKAIIDTINWLKKHAQL